MNQENIGLQPTQTFMVETTVIPANVDLILAGKRSKLIESWRAGENDAESTLRDLIRLYWSNQKTADEQTRFYLMDATTDFAVEANMDPEVMSRIWQEEMRNR